MYKMSRFKSVQGPLVLLCLAAMVPNHAAEPAGGAAAAVSEWNLNDLYASDAGWDEAFNQLKAASAALKSYQGKLGGSAAALFKALDAVSQAGKTSSRLGTYAGLRSDVDLRVAPNRERVQRIQALGTEINENTSWLAPEILKIGAQRIRGFLAQHTELSRRFGFYLNNTLRGAPHTLGLEAEGVLASVGTLLQQPDALHSEFTNAEMPFSSIKLSDGASVQLGAAAYEKYRQVNNRADRQLVFDSYWASWKKFEGTLGSMLATQVMGNVFSARSRHFGSALESALFPDNMPAAVYERLVAETNAGLPTLHRYLRLRKRVLGIADDLRYYDNYPALFPLPSPKQYNVAESERLSLAALQPLGEEYLGLLKQGFSNRWMSVFPGEGKRSGAYMNGSAYDVHPYLLLNHNSDFASVSTFAHEWGHAVHTMLATRSQPFELANYSTFTAESASIGNQMLLSDFMVEQAPTRAEKLYFLGESLESIRTIFFRQVMFAEFELALHREVEQGRPLSGSRMTDMYCTLLRKYYGEAAGVMKIDPSYCVEWAYIPHFYYNFYLYQYATSMAGAAYLTADITKSGAPARERFLTLLRAGGSDYPYELYKRAGLDMAQSTAYQALIARMNRLMDDIEKLEQQN